jgi:hypothetical protein
MNDLKLPDSVLKKAETIAPCPETGRRLPFKEFWRELYAICNEDEKREVAGRWALVHSAL